MERSLRFSGVLACFLAAMAACVGDDPSSPTETSPEAGTGTDQDSGGTSPEAPTGQDSSAGDTGTDGHVPTCAGQTFAAPVPVGTGQISSALATTMWGVRAVGPNAYFAATPSGSSEQQIFRATYTAGTGGAGPSLSNASVLTPPSSTSVVEWAPTVSADGALLVFATAFPPPRDLSFSIGSGGGFGAPTPIAALNTTSDETDPWLVGKPTATALYFARNNSASAQEIWRSAVSAGPSFAAPVKVTLVCAQANCGTPVVTPDEKTLLYSSYASGGFVPNVEESSLSVVSGTGTAGAAIGHPELGTHYPSWVSDDGCEVLLGGQGISTVSDMYYARRTAK